MELDRFKANLDSTIDAMRVQTGKEPGGPTGLCHPFVVSVLTGAEVEFAPAALPSQQDLMEGRSGLHSYPVHLTRGTDRSLLVPAALEQRTVSADAVIVEGTIRDISERHIVAVVPENGEPPYHVVDSVLPGGTSGFETTVDVVQFVEERFDVDTVTVRIVPDAEDRKSRDSWGPVPQHIAEGIIIQAPFKKPEDGIVFDLSKLKLQ